MSFANLVMKKHRISGDRNSVKKLIFTIKSKITVLSTKLRRYETQEASKKQNEMFMKNRKQFYRGLEAEAEHKIPNPPSKEELRQFWGEKYLARQISTTRAVSGFLSGGNNMKTSKSKNGVH